MGKFSHLPRKITVVHDPVRGDYERMQVYNPDKKVKNDKQKSKLTPNKKSDVFDVNNKLSIKDLAKINITKVGDLISDDTGARDRVIKSLSFFSKNYNKNTPENVENVKFSHVFDAIKNFDFVGKNDVVHVFPLLFHILRKYTTDGEDIIKFLSHKIVNNDRDFVGHMLVDNTLFGDVLYLCGLLNGGDYKGLISDFYNVMSMYGVRDKFEDAMRNGDFLITSPYNYIRNNDNSIKGFSYVFRQIFGNDKFKPSHSIEFFVNAMYGRTQDILDSMGSIGQSSLFGRLLFHRGYIFNRKVEKDKPLVHIDVIGDRIQSFTTNKNIARGFAHVIKPTNINKVKDEYGVIINSDEVKHKFKDDVSELVEVISDIDFLDKREIELGYILSGTLPDTKRIFFIAHGPVANKYFGDHKYIELKRFFEHEREVMLFV